MTRWRRSPVLATIALAALIATAGCLGLGDDDQEADGSIAPAQTGDLPTTAATRALWDAGLKDPYLDVQANGRVVEVDLWVDEKAVLAPYDDQEIWSFAFATGPDEPGQVPGPEIRVTQGDTVRVTLHDPANEYELPGHTMHWHGVDLPWRMDGVPFVTQDITPAGEEGTYTYEFVARQPGTYWYHCVMEFPAHIDTGMFGALIVEPRNPNEDLPFDREETLFFHEADSQMLSASGWALNPNMDPNPDQLSKNPVDAADSAKSQARFAADLAGSVVGAQSGEYLFSEGPRDYFPAWSARYKPHYDTFMIDGKSYPDTEPVTIREGETLRLRLINAGQSHKSIHLHGHHMLVTHNDGYPLPIPHWEDTLNLAPGERKDVYVQGTNPGIWSLHDHSGIAESGTTNANDYAFPGGMKTVLVYEGFQPPEGLPAGGTSHNTAGDYAVFAHGGQR